MGRKRKLPDGLWERSGTYYARFRANGREVRKRLSSDYRAACEMLNELRARADKADFDLIDNDYSFAELKKEFVTWARQNIRRPGEYERHLKNVELYRPIGRIREIDHSFVVGYRNWRMAGDATRDSVCPRTANIEMNTLRAMLNKGVEWKRIGSNPVAGMKPLKHEETLKNRRSLTIEEVQAIFDKSPDYLKPVWRMFMCTGIRKIELISLLFSDVDFENRLITIRASVAKSGQAREIPLDDTMFEMLRGLQEAAKHRQPVRGTTPKKDERQRANFTRQHVFVTRANTPLVNNLLDRFYRVCKKAGIDDGQRGGSVDLHSLRVSFATLSLENGANPKAVQDILGHSTLAMTMSVYAKATGRSKREAVGALPFASVSAPKHIVGADCAHSAHKNAKPKSKAS